MQTKEASNTAFGCGAAALASLAVFALTFESQNTLLLVLAIAGCLAFGVAALVYGAKGLRSGVFPARAALGILLSLAPLAAVGLVATFLVALFTGHIQLD